MLRPGKLYVNTTVRININFQDEDGVDVDPATVTFKTLSPSCVEATYVYLTDTAVGKSSVGDYFADVVPDEAGRWSYRWVTTGTGTATAFEGAFLVQDSAFFRHWPVWDYAP